MEIQDVSGGMSFRLIVTDVSTMLLPSSLGLLDPSATPLPVDTMQQGGGREVFEKTPFVIVLHSW